MKPRELEEAEVIESLCRHYHITPPEALALPVWVFRHMALIAEGRPPEKTEG